MNLIEKNFIAPESKIDKKAFKPASYLRRAFTLKSEIQSAELNITACGLYTGFINGQPITDQKFMPGFTYYTKRLQYHIFDITALLQTGENAIGIILGDGWYRGKIGVFSKRNQYGEKVKLSAVLDVLFKDGSTRRITTDDKWKATQEGPIRKSDWKDGEIYDARREMNGWATADFTMDESKWHQIDLASYNGVLIPAEGEPILEHERFIPEVLQTHDGSTVLDFKQNLFGYVEFTVNGDAGHTVRLIHGETLDEKGNFTQKNLKPEGFIFSKKNDFQVVEYTLKEGTQTFKPHFTAHGFRYVKLEKWPEKVVPENFSSIAIYSDCEMVGDFECSNPLVNRLVKNAMWSQKSNFLDIPTDCPQRERAGWTGDIACYAPAAVYLMNCRKFLSKWLGDLAAQQRDDGAVGSIVPAVGMPDFVDGAAGWADAAVIIPYVLYRTYGDTEILKKQYSSMKKWIEFLQNRVKKTHPSRWFKRNPHKDYTIDSGFHWGEWLEPGHIMGVDAVKGFFWPDFEVATAYYAYAVKIMAEIVAVLGKDGESQHYLKLFEKIKEGYKYNYTDKGAIDSDRQCKYVRPVALNLISDEEKENAMENLNQMVIDTDYRIGTGFLTTPFILQLLSDYGYAETAYGLLENEKRPGWLYEVKNGATTIWENWNGKDEDGVPKDSFNHYLMGSVVGWLFSHAAGIRPIEPGYQKILIKPVIGGSFTHVSCRYKSASGLIKSSWKLKGDQFSLEVEVPVDAQVQMPDGIVHNVEKGTHEFTCAY